MEYAGRELWKQWDNTHADIAGKTDLFEISGAGRVS